MIFRILKYTVAFSVVTGLLFLNYNLLSDIIWPDEKEAHNHEGRKDVVEPGDSEIISYILELFPNATIKLREDIIEKRKKYVYQKDNLVGITYTVVEEIP